MTQSVAASTMRDIIRRVASRVVGPAAVDVDRDARLPAEALTALRHQRLLAAAIPAAFGGLGYGMSALAEIAQVLGQHCASTAMIWAMHQIQLACLVRHGSDVPRLRTYLRKVAEHQHLIASITSEVGVGGDIRTSLAAVEPDGSGWRLEKHGSTVSYGAHADAFLVTARRAPDAAAGDQVLVFLTRDASTLEQTSTWHTLGMRGTCSAGFKIVSRFASDNIFPQPFADICAETMVPFSHILWSACWLGIATDAVRRAAQFLRARARDSRRGAYGAIPAPDPRLADAGVLLHQMRGQVQRCAAAFDSESKNATNGRDHPVRTGGLSNAIELNALKIGCSELVVRIVALSLEICGMAGYSTDGPYSVERHLRDAYSASSMIGNARLKATNATMLLLQREI